MTETVKEYGTSLRYGHKRIHESLPRMLTLWFDIGDAVVKTEAEGGGGAGGAAAVRAAAKEKKVCAEVTATMKGFLSSLPPFTW